MFKETYKIFHLPISRSAAAPKAAATARKAATAAGKTSAPATKSATAESAASASLYQCEEERNDAENDSENHATAQYQRGHSYQTAIHQGAGKGAQYAAKN